MSLGLISIPSRAAVQATGSSEDVESSLDRRSRHQRGSVKKRFDSLLTNIKQTEGNLHQSEKRESRREREREKHFLSVWVSAANVFAASQETEL